MRLVDSWVEYRKVLIDLEQENNYPAAKLVIAETRKRYQDVALAGLSVGDLDLIHFYLSQISKDSHRIEAWITWQKVS